jgi:hypothetical protein
MKQKHLLTQNAKMKKSGDRIFNFGIPAYKSKTGQITCPYAGVCAKGCYAQSGTYLWSNVSQAYEARLEATKQDDFIDRMVNEIKSRKIAKVRIHDSGDFYSLEYLDKWLSIMAQLPSVKFYAYTKSIPFFKARSIPDNFRVIFSYGGKLDHLIDDNTQAHSKVFPSLVELLDNGYKDVSHDDNLIYDTNKIGLVFHHAKKYDNTEWNKIHN